MASHFYVRELELLVDEEVGTVNLGIDWTLTSPAQPAQTSGPPERCHPAESAEIYIDAVTMQLPGDKMEWTPAWPWLADIAEEWAHANVEILVEDADA